MGLARVSARPRTWMLAGAGIANVVAVGYLLWDLGQYLDLEVYRLGARTWLDSGDLYGTLPVTSAGIALPFTYPPFAAVLFTPLTLVAVPVAGALLAGLGLVVLAAVVLVVLGEWSRWRVVAAAVVPVAVALEPVRATLEYGQVNLVLMGLVVLDCLVVSPRWPRGVLVGLAAAVKLVPAAFVLFFLLRRDGRAAVRAGAAFLAGTGLGFVLAREESLRFWSETLWDTGRIGTVHYAGNQSLLAVLARFGLEPPLRTPVWLLASAAVLVIAVIGMRRALDAGFPELALGLNALALLVISPVSWSHHWVWSVPVLLVLFRLGSVRSVALAGAGLVVFTMSPQWWWLAETSNVEYNWHIGQQLLGNAYLYVALAVLVVAASGSVPPRQGHTPAPLIARSAAPSVIRRGHAGP